MSMLAQMQQEMRGLPYTDENCDPPIPTHNWLSWFLYDGIMSMSMRQITELSSDEIAQYSGRGWLAEFAHDPGDYATFEQALAQFKETYGKVAHE